MITQPILSLLKKLFWLWFREAHVWEYSPVPHLTPNRICPFYATKWALGLVMLVSAGQVPTQRLRLVQVFLPPSGAFKSAHFPRLAWQFNHLLNFLRAKAHVLPRLGSKEGFALVWHRQEFREETQPSTLGPFSLSMLIPSDKRLTAHVFQAPHPLVWITVRNVPALIVDFTIWVFSYNLGCFFMVHTSPIFYIPPSPCHRSQDIGWWWSIYMLICSHGLTWH